MLMRRNTDIDNRRARTQEGSSMNTKNSTKLRNGSPSDRKLFDPRIGLFDLSKELSTLNIRVEKIPCSVNDNRNFYLKFNIPAMRSFPPQLLQMLQAMNGNDVCVDCALNSEKIVSENRPVTWANVTFGTLICNECAFEYFNTNKCDENQISLLSISLSFWTLPDVLVMFEGGNGRLVEELHGNKKINFLRRRSNQKASRRPSDSSDDVAVTAAPPTAVKGKGKKSFSTSFRNLKPLRGAINSAIEKMSEKYETKAAKDYQLSLAKRVAQVCSLYCRCDITADAILEQRLNRGTNIGAFETQLPTTSERLSSLPSAEMLPSLSTDDKDKTDEDKHKAGRPRERRRSLSWGALPDAIKDMKEQDDPNSQNHHSGISLSSSSHTRTSEKSSEKDSSASNLPRRNSFFNFQLVSEDDDDNEKKKESTVSSDTTRIKEHSNPKKERLKSSNKKHLKKSSARRNEVKTHNPSGKEPEETGTYIAGALENKITDASQTPSQVSNSTDNDSDVAVLLQLASQKNSAKQEKVVRDEKVAKDEKVKIMPVNTKCKDTNSRHLPEKTKSSNMQLACVEHKPLPLKNNDTNCHNLSENTKSSNMQLTIVENKPLPLENTDTILPNLSEKNSSSNMQLARTENKPLPLECSNTSHTNSLDLPEKNNSSNTQLVRVENNPLLLNNTDDAITHSLDLPEKNNSTNMQLVLVENKRLSRKSSGAMILDFPEKNKSSNTQLVRTENKRVPLDSTEAVIPKSLEKNKSSNMQVARVENKRHSLDSTEAMVPKSSERTKPNKKKLARGLGKSLPPNSSDAMISNSSEKNESFNRQLARDVHLRLSLGSSDTSRSNRTEKTKPSNVQLSRVAYNRLSLNSCDTSRSIRTEKTKPSNMRVVNKPLSQDRRRGMDPPEEKGPECSMIIFGSKNHDRANNPRQRGIDP